jgi:flagellar hook-basal body complex protein FliE
MIVLPCWPFKGSINLVYACFIQALLASCSHQNNLAFTGVGGVMNSLGSVDKVLSQLQAASSIKRGAAQSGITPQADFSKAVTQALNNVSSLQENSSQLQRRFQMEDPNVSLEQTMVAMQKSQIAFQSALQVRNRLVQAYSDIMNMQV